MLSLGLETAAERISETATIGKCRSCVGRAPEQRAAHAVVKLELASNLHLSISMTGWPQHRFGSKGSACGSRERAVRQPTLDATDGAAVNPKAPRRVYPCEPRRADDHVIFADGLRLLLETHCDVVGSVADGRALITEALRLKPDVIVVDIGMPLLNGLDAAKRVREQLPRVARISNDAAILTWLPPLLS